MKREKFSYYEFEIYNENKVENDDAWVYEIYYPEYPELPAMRISLEYFDTEQEARCAAIGHICLLEEGEG